MKNFSYDDYKKAAQYIKTKTPSSQTIAIVLGSGLSSICDEIEDKITIKYSDIPNFPKSTVGSHKGEMHIGRLNGVQVIVMSGRTHFYEGYSFSEITFYIRVLWILGIKSIILTNAAGGINENFVPGDLMLINDHIKFFSDSPVRGKNIDEFGNRFFDMSDTYCKQYREISLDCANNLNVELKQGVYAFMGGPQFETPAEIRMLKILGADAVGMSTVGEAICANQVGMKILGISCISNLAAGVSDQPISDDDVVVVAKLASNKFKRLIKEIIGKINAI